MADSANQIARIAFFYMSNPASPTPAVPRRTFLKSSATLAAGAAVAASKPTFLTAAERKRSIGANDRIRIAHIGVGSRGREAHFVNGTLPHLKEMNFEVVAFADPWKHAGDQMNARVRWRRS